MSPPKPLTPERARAWGRYAETSPLYQHLNEVIAGDDSLMSVLNRIEHIPRQNILFAGVQYLMSRDGGGPLAEFYPNFTEEPRPFSGLGEEFAGFVLDHADELVAIGRTRYTQTNECRRCVALLPAVWATGATRFHLVDLGTSAGLNLLLDRYAYRWGEVSWGEDSPVELTTESRGVPVQPGEIDVLSRTGLDLHPVDPGDPEDRRWLEALIWPEHHQRRERLRAALSIAATAEMDFVAGDALSLLGPALDALPEGEPVVVMHSFVLNQLDRPSRGMVGEIIAGCRERRPIHRISLEALDAESPAAELSIDSGRGLETIGHAQPHGEWLELYARP